MIKINGVEYEGNNIHVTTYGVQIDGKSITLGEKITVLNIEGNINNLHTTSADVVVKGDVRTISTVSGDVQCRNVDGTIKTVSGDVNYTRK